MSKPFLIGLTGSIGMGKSTTARMFADEGVPVWDADAAVDRLYRKGGAAVPAVQKIYPSAVKDGAIDRGVLKTWLVEDVQRIGVIESIVHPLVAQDRLEFISTCTTDVVLLDIPLLFETGGETAMDAVVVVSTSAENQRKRVMDRGTMTKQQFETILAKQLPDSQKRQRADYVIETETLEAARAQVQNVLAKIRERIADA